MHLFYQPNAENLPPSERLDPVWHETDLRKKLEARREEWIAFFEEYKNVGVCYYEPLMEIFENYFAETEMIQLQTSEQKERSREFFQFLIQGNKQRVLIGHSTACAFIHLAVLYGNYNSLFRSNAKQLVDSLPTSVFPEPMSELFFQLLVRYPDTGNFKHVFQYLDSFETRIHMSFLAGKKIRGEYYMGQYFSPKMLNQILRFTFKNKALSYPSENMFLRNWILIRSIELLEDEEQALKILMSNHTFQYEPARFFKDLDYWLIAIRLVANTYENRPYVEYMDFLEYNLYRETHRVDITNWNVDVLELSAEIWHNEIPGREDMDNIYDDMKWMPAKNLYEFTFKHLGVSYSAVQLTTGKLLRDEGQIMKNCVLTYVRNCADQYLSIWSIREKRKINDKNLLTVEVNSEDTIVQVVRKANNPIQLKQYEILEVFAKEMEYKIMVEKPLM